jgi:hypothetical protein
MSGVHEYGLLCMTPDGADSVLCFAVFLKLALPALLVESEGLLLGAVEPPMGVMSAASYGPMGCIRLQALPLCPAFVLFHKCLAKMI